MTDRPRDIEALALLEIDGLPRAVSAHDAALKRAAVHVFACAPVSPGKVVLILGGDVASVEESMQAAEAVVGERLLDRLFLPGIDPKVPGALTGDRQPRNGESMGILEVVSVASVLLGADVAVKAVDVNLGRLHAATGFGGKGYFTVLGTQPDVEAAIEAVRGALVEKLVDHEVIAAPHDELEDGVFKRPWPLDPAN